VEGLLRRDVTMPVAPVVGAPRVAWNCWELGAWSGLCGEIEQVSRRLLGDKRG
jgi:hypothetical protein